MEFWSAKKLVGQRVTLQSTLGDEVIAGKVMGARDFDKGCGEIQIGNQWWPVGFLRNYKPKPDWKAMKRQKQQREFEDDPVMLKASGAYN